MNQNKIVVPETWRALDVDSWRSPILIFGASDSGKSTFARYLYGRLAAQHNKVAFIDADIGQSSFGLPATIVAALGGRQSDRQFPPDGVRRMAFAGSNTPAGSMLAVLLGLYRMKRFVLREKADAVIVDTSGMIDPARGGTNLKWAKVELFRPCTVVALARAKELEPLLSPMRHLPGVNVVELPVCDAVRPRTTEARRAYRAACYRAYFASAQRLPLVYRQLAVFPDHNFTPGRLAALEGRDGFTLALGLIDAASDVAVWLRTPWSGQGRLSALRLGNVRIDMETFYDAHL
ncbi:MAG: Clp1/GlmU family protein [Anaerolineae bacterium]